MIVPRRLSAFTLVELIIVMALLAVVMAVAAPSLARSMKERNLADEAARILSATEYARSEAVSQGVPMIVWIEPAARRIGVEPKAGFEGEPTRIREFVWNVDIRIETAEKAAPGKVIEWTEFGARSTDRHQRGVDPSRRSLWGGADAGADPGSLEL